MDLFDRISAVPAHVWIGWLVMGGLAYGLTVYIGRGSPESTRGSSVGCAVLVWIMLGGSVITWLLPDVLYLFGYCVEGRSCPP